PAMSPTKMPPRTSGFTPESIDPRTAIITRYPSAPARPATPPPSRAKPTDAPIAKRSGRLSKPASPPWAIAFTFMRSGCPRRRSKPAIGRTAVGSMSDPPSCWALAKWGWDTGVLVRPRRAGGMRTLLLGVRLLHVRRDGDRARVGGAADREGGEV